MIYFINFFYEEVNASWYHHREAQNHSPEHSLSTSSSSVVLLHISNMLVLLTGLLKALVPLWLLKYFS